MSNVPAVIALVVVAVLALFADHQNSVVSEQRMRANVAADLSVIRAKLEGNINGNLQLVRGLVATLSTEPTMSQERFEQLAGLLFRDDSQLRNIAGAPDLVISLMYPMAGNERAIGLDYRNNEAQRDAALKARDTGELVLAGPIDLVQGGKGFIGRFPVFVDEPDGGRHFWGIVRPWSTPSGSTATAACSHADLPLDIALAGIGRAGRCRSTCSSASRASSSGQPVTADDRAAFRARGRSPAYPRPAGTSDARECLVLPPDPGHRRGAGGDPADAGGAPGRRAPDGTTGRSDAASGSSGSCRTGWNWRSTRRRSASGSTIW